MKLIALTEATDVSDFGEQVIHEALPIADRKLRSVFKRFENEGRKQNPDDYVTAAYDALNRYFNSHDHLSREATFKNIITESIQNCLQTYILQRFGSTSTFDKPRDNSSLFDGNKRFAASYRIRFVDKLPGASGEYDRHEIVVEVPNNAWSELSDQWLENFFFDSTTLQTLQEWVINQNFFDVMIHEVTHLVNDHLGSTHQNTSFLKQGKEYFNPDYQHDDKLLSHLSRTSELQTYASQIAFEMIKEQISHWSFDPKSERSYREIAGRINDILRDLTDGYARSNTYDDKMGLIDQKIEDTTSPGKRTQLIRMRKKLNKLIVQNLMLYQQRFYRKAQELQ